MRNVLIDYFQITSNYLKTLFSFVCGRDYYYALRVNVFIISIMIFKYLTNEGADFLQEKSRKFHTRKSIYETILFMEIYSIM